MRTAVDTGTPTIQQQSDSDMAQSIAATKQAASNIVTPARTTPAAQGQTDPLHDHTKQPTAPAGNTYVWIPTDAPSGGIWSLHQNAPSGGGNTPVPVGANGKPVGIFGSTDYSTESGNQNIQNILSGIIGFSPAQINQFYADYKSGIPMSRIYDDIRATPQYAQRFPGMAALVKTGNRISEGDYILKENADRQLMNTYLGPAASSFNTTAQLGNLIANNVSTTELQGRLQAANDAVLKAPASETQWFKDQGLTQGDLTAYWLNPDVALTDIQRRANMGQLGGIALDAGTGINAAQANTLAAEGISPDQAKSGFGQIGMEGQFKQQLPGESNTPVTQQDLLDATFSNNAQAQQKVNLLRQQRQAQFQENGGVVATGQGVTGLSSAATQ